MNDKLKIGCFLFIAIVLLVFFLVSCNRHLQSVVKFLAPPTATLVITTPTPDPVVVAISQLECTQHDKLTTGLVTLCFDDERWNTYSVAYPLLQHCGYRGVLGIVADRDAILQKLASEYVIPMPWWQVEELVEVGWEVSSHSLTHAHLENLHGDQLEKEIVQSKFELVGRGFDISVFVPPYGEWNEEGINLASKHYRGYRTLDMGVNPLPVVDFMLSCFSINSSTTKDEIQSWISQTEEEHGWLIVTIQSVVYEPSNDWEISIDQFVDLLNSISSSKLVVVTASEALDHPGFGKVTPTSTSTPTTISTSTPTSILFSPTATPRATSSATPTPTVTLTSTPTPKLTILLEGFHEEMVILDIPVIDVQSKIEAALPTGENELDLDFSKIHEVPLWVSYTREIGEPGVALVIGHRQWGPKPKVFAKLDQLKVGDVVQVASDQYIFVYIVEEANIVVDPSNVWGTIEAFDNQAIEVGKSMLALLTCTPYGTDWQRLMVFTNLKEVIHRNGL